MTMPAKKRPNLELGNLVVTRAVSDAMKDPGFTEFVKESLERHKNNDWGDLCAEDRKVNSQALRDGARIMSVYKSPSFETIWIITEWDRSVTTVLFPDDC